MTKINPVYRDFQTYSSEKSKKTTQDMKKYVPLVGSALGAGLSYAYFAKKYKGISDKEVGAIKTGLKYITMCASSITGGVVAGSIGAKPDSIKRKIKEGAFQMMNMAIPMTFVSLFHYACQNIKALDKKPVKVLGSIAAMVSGAGLATLITNNTKGENQPKRKYSIKDATANFDDLVATVAIGFGKELNQAQNFALNAVIPFIYAYNGMRAGRKE